jgi:hypothetical protein
MTANPTREQPPFIDWSICLNGHEVLIVSPVLKRSFRIIGQSPVTPMFVIRGSPPNPKGVKEQATFGFFQSWGSKPEPGKPTTGVVTPILRIEPTNALLLAHEEGVTHRLTSDRLFVESKALKMEVDSFTGRVIEVRWQDPQADNVMSLTFQNEAFDAAYRETLRLIELAADQNKSDSFLAAVVVIAADVWAVSFADKDDQRFAQRILGKLLTSEALAPLNGLTRGPSGGAFIRMDSMTPTGHLDFFSSWSGLGLNVSRQLFPVDSPFHAVHRFFAFRWLQRFEATNQQLKETLDHPQLGPIACWYGSSLASMTNPTIQARLSRKGLDRLDAEWLRTEVEPWLISESALGASLRAILKQLRQLDDDELRWLAKSLAGQGTEAAQQQFVQLMRKNAGRSPAAQFMELADHLWASGLQDVVRQRLESLNDSATKTLAGKPVETLVDLAKSFPLIYGPATIPKPVVPANGSDETQNVRPAQATTEVKSPRKTDPAKPVFALPDTEPAKPLKSPSNTSKPKLTIPD